VPVLSIRPDRTGTGKWLIQIKAHVECLAQDSRIGADLIGFAAHFYFADDQKGAQG
jgi:hypothetical protein